MAKNLMKKIRQHRVAVPLKFSETVKDKNGREQLRFSVYPVYMSRFSARRVNTPYTIEDCYSNTYVG